MNLFKIKYIIVLVLFGALLTGCGASYKTMIKPVENKSNILHIEVDQDSTMFGMLQSGNIIRVNYKYSFGVAAKSTVDRGFKYFSIYNPKKLKTQFVNRNVQNINDAYLACDSGEGSFHIYLSLKDLGSSISQTLKGEALVDRTNNCDNILFGWSENTIKGTTTHETIKYFIELHNEDRQDNITFNAKDVLKSDLLKDLNTAYFVQMTR